MENNVYKITVAICLTLAWAIFSFSVMYRITSSEREQTKIAVACVQSGGSWAYQDRQYQCLGKEKKE